MSEIVHKPGKDRNLIYSGEIRSADKLTRKIEEKYPFIVDEHLGRKGTLSYNFQIGFKPLKAFEKTTTIDSKLYIEILNNKCMSLDGLLSFEKGTGRKLIKLLERIAKYEEISYIYFAVNVDVSPEMVKTAYTNRYLPFAHQGNIYYFGKRI